jgi:hypothetical protein
MLERQFRKAGGERSLYRACLLQGLRARHPLTANPWPEDHVIDLVLKAAQDPTSMANTPDLVTVMYEFLTSLQPMSAAAALFAASINLSFGSAGGIALPAIADTPQAVWVREGAPIPVAIGLSSLIALTPFKMGTILALSNEMMRSSSAEAAMRAMILSNMGPALDLALFSNAAGVPGLNPPGLLNGVPALTASTATGMSEAMIEDMQILVKALAPYGGNGGIAFVASADCWVRMTKTAVGEKGIPVFVASNLITPTLIAVAAQALVVAMDPPTIEVGNQAVFHLEDDPTLVRPIVDDAGVLAAPVRSMWQTDSVGLKFRLPVSWALRAPAVAWLVPIWGAPTPGP